MIDPELDASREEPATSPALWALVAGWPGPALLFGLDGKVEVASPQAGIVEGMSIPFDLPHAASPATTRDGGGRRWTISETICGFRVAIGETQRGLDAESRFTAAVSHEIRTPLNGIMGMAALLEEGELAPDQREYAQAIRRSGARLLDLLNNVLDFSRIGAGDVPLEYSPFSPADLVQDVAELLAPRAHGAGLDLAAIVDPELPPHMLGDAGRLRQILFNLAGNAVKFTESGGVLLEVRRGPAATGMSLIVRDTGMGVPEEAMSRLFDAFSQARAGDSQRDGGVGLGLAIVAHLSRAMKGEVSVVSTPGGGAMFRVDLPLGDVAAFSQAANRTLSGATIALNLPPASALTCTIALGEAQATVIDATRDAVHNADVAVIDAALPPTLIARTAQRNPTLVVLRPEDRSRIEQFRKMGCVGYLIRPLRAASILERVLVARTGRVSDADDDHEQDGSDTPPGTAGRVLIADDNAVNTLLASRALSAAGYHVDTAGTGAEALERAGETSYDVIFMDIRMPVMDGLEATRRIRRLPGDASETAIVAVTADINPELETRAREAGVSQLAAKPIDPPQLRKLAETWSARRRQAAE